MFETTVCTRLHLLALFDRFPQLFEFLQRLIFFDAQDVLKVRRLVELQLQSTRQ